MADRATVEDPPTFPMFAVTHTKTANESATQPAFTQPAIPPAYMLPFCLSASCLHGSSAHNSTSFLQKFPVPSLSVFLNDLDVKHGKDEYTCYEENFLNEKIDVGLLGHLTDAQLIELGVNIMGHRITLVTEAKKFQQ